MHQYIGRLRIVALTSIALCTTLAHAAFLEISDREHLLQQAEQQGFAAVQVAVESHSLDALREAGSAAIKASTQSKAAALRAELGEDVLDVGGWVNDLGHTGLLVTAAGLARLEQSPLAQAIQPDSTRRLRQKAWLAPQAEQAIERTLTTQGFADVEITLHSDAPYQIDANGNTIFQQHRAEITKHFADLMALPLGRHIKIINDAQVRTGARPTFTARIDRPAYAAFRIESAIRAIRPTKFQPASLWANDVHDALKAENGADIIIQLWGGENYSPYEGYLTASAWKAQSAAHQQVFDEILKDIGATNKTTKVYEGIGALHVQLNSKSLRALFDRRDARIQSVRLNRLMGKPTLTNSAALMNMPSAWSLGYRAAGQYILVLDTGVRKSHLFFKDSFNNSRVIFESCFGTNSQGYQSVCPNQDSQGDSPIGEPNSGQLYQNATFCAAYSSDCAHGTHVAGIAAGHSNPFLSPSTIQGVGPDAQIAAVQIFSFPPANRPGAFNADVLAALNLTYSGTIPGVITPFTVNISMGDNTHSSDCPTIDSSISNMMANLVSRGVPVVIAAGNNSQLTGIAWPACIPSAIKVSSVLNDATGTTRAAYAQLGNPSNYSNPILLAPGSTIKSSMHTSDSALDSMSGTSMATPQVSGYYAVVKAAVPTATVADVTSWIVLSSSIAVPITLPSGTHTFRRIRF